MRRMKKEYFYVVTAIVGGDVMVREEDDLAELEKKIEDILTDAALGAGVRFPYADVNLAP